MKKILYTTLAFMLILFTACQDDYLDVSSPSSVDQDFVFSSPDEAYKVVVGCYNIWRECNNGLFYDLDVVGSDAEYHPETYDAQLRHIPEGLYASEISIDYSNAVGAWEDLYQVANRANIIMEAIGEKDEYVNAVAEGKANDWTQLYGEAAVFRAYAYHNLIRYFGDVPHFSVAIYSTSQTDSTACTSRDEIYDFEISELMRVEPLMYRLGEGGINAERFSRTFAQGLIGKMALFAGGYSLRRTDFDYGNVTFEQIGTERWNAKYVRRTDYQDYYEIAKTYLEACVSNSGSAYLITSDDRGAGFNNPFQRNYQYNMDLEVSPESLYEVGCTRAQGNSERPYAFGRPSGGGNSNAYPCKNYGQSRLQTSFYYGEFDPLDMRRDVTATVTANSGSCSERLVSFVPGSREKGGLPNNKWDESRMSDPYTASRRQSGVNWPQMRMADVILMLAEVYAELGQDGAAREELKKVRSRAFPAEYQQDKVNTYVAGLSGDALKEAIQQERKFEFAGEGFRRYDLIRTGKMPEKIKEVRDEQEAMVNGLKTQGYYTFENGNTISSYIWVKAVNVADLGMSNMLTTQCDVDESDSTYPVKYPSWRGNCDLWEDNGFTASSGERSLAIKGLFRYIDPDGAEAAALEAEGYEKTVWGINIVNNEDQYTSDIFKGYPDEFYTGGVPPRYLLPLSSETISKSNGLIANGYGFSQQ
ncbi:MAG: RagB/SusD family nutrient uptake outer membrane protein [Mangrovibacterium sp.]